MSITVNELTNLADTTNGTTYTTSSISPNANAGLVAAVYTPGSTTGSPTLTGPGGATWTLEGTQLNGVGGRLLIYSLFTGSSPGSGGVTFDCTVDDANGADIAIVQCTGVDLTDFFVKMGTQQLSVAGTPTPAFGSATASDATVIGFVGNNSNPAGMTPPSGYTELSDIGFNTPSSGLETCFHTSPGAVTTVTWGSTTATAGAAAVCEVKLGPAITSKVIVIA